MSFQESSCGNEAIKDCRNGGVWVACPKVGELESNCDAKRMTHLLFHSLFFLSTMANMEFFRAGIWPNP